MLVHLSLSILITKCKIITGEFQKAYIYFVPFDSIHFRTVCLWKLLMLTTGVVFHDAIYQFIRIFYHSRFKPDNLQMTLVQWAMPVVDLIFFSFFFRHATTQPSKPNLTFHYLLSSSVCVLEFKLS